MTFAYWEINWCCSCLFTPQFYVNKAVFKKTNKMLQIYNIDSSEALIKLADFIASCLPSKLYICQSFVLSLLDVTYK